MSNAFYCPECGEALPEGETQNHYCERCAESVRLEEQELGGDGWCPECHTPDPFHPFVADCLSCADARQSIIEEAEREAGWDPNP